MIDGALATHPVVGCDGWFRANPFNDPDAHELAEVDDDTVRQKLQRVNRAR